MQINELSIPDTYEIILEPKSDSRGSLTRLYDIEAYECLSKTGMRIVQINHQRTVMKGTIRGLHFKVPPEQKAVQCIRGVVWDVIVDLRKNSPTYLKWQGTTLAEDDNKIIYIPKWFAHGTQALTDHAELLYFHSDFYEPDSEKGIRFDDPKLDILWPLPVDNISTRDSNLAYLADDSDSEEIPTK